MNELKITYFPIGELIPYANNPRKNDAAVDKVAASIKEFGFRVPIVIDKNKEIVCGHTRLKAAKKLKLKEIPCVMADDLTDEQIKAYRLADNKVSEFADWDDELLDLELDDIDLDMEQFGFEITEPSEDFSGGASMADKYLVPPFSVLRGDSGEWMSRKREWESFGIDSGKGRN